MAAVQPNLLHQVYNQSLLSRRAMPADVALVMYKRAIGVVQDHDHDFVPEHPPNPEGLAAFLDDITRLLEPLGLVVEKTFTEEEGKQWIALCNAESGEVSQQATDLTPLEISYVRNLINEIVASYPANSVGSAAALRLTSGLDGQMTKAAAEQLLMALTSRGWFAKSKRGRYSLGTRALMELDHYLREEYEGQVNDCARCEKLVMIGTACLTPDCDVHLHKYCFDQMQRLGAKCPGCKEELNVAEVGEGAVPRNQDDWASVPGRRRQARQSGAQDDDEELESEDGNVGTQGSASIEQRAVEAEGEASQSQRHGETIIPDSIDGFGSMA